MFFHLRIKKNKPKAPVPSAQGGHSCARPLPQLLARQAAPRKRPFVSAKEPGSSIKGV